MKSDRWYFDEKYKYKSNFSSNIYLEGITYLIVAYI